MAPRSHSGFCLSILPAKLNCLALSEAAGAEPLPLLEVRPEVVAVEESLAVAPDLTTPASTSASAATAVVARRSEYVKGNAEYEEAARCGSTHERVCSWRNSSRTALRREERARSAGEDDAQPAQEARAVGVRRCRARETVKEEEEEEAE